MFCSAKNEKVSSSRFIFFFSLQRLFFPTSQKTKVEEIHEQKHNMKRELLLCQEIHSKNILKSLVDEDDTNALHHKTKLGIMRDLISTF